MHVSNALRLDGTGHTNSTIDLAIAHAESGHHVVCICHRSDDTTRRLLAAHGVELVEGVGVRTVRSVWRSRNLVRSALRRADVIHLHTVRSLAVASTLGPVRAWRRSVATIHNPHQRSVGLMYVGRRIVSLSEANRSHVRRRTLGLRKPRVILNATLGTPRLRPLVDVRSAPLPPRSIVFVGALHHRKGLDVLLTAMLDVLREVPDATLHVVGNRDAPAFERLARDLGIERSVRFVGFHPDPREYMAAASAFVLPSREEGFGNVLTEARECAVPIVATSVGGIPEALSDGRAGVLVPTESPRELASALVRILLDPAHAAALRSATQQGLETMRVSRAAKQYMGVYRSISVRSRRRVRRDTATR